MLLAQGIKHIAENELFLGMFFFSLFWASLVNIGGSKILSTMGKKEVKGSFAITIVLSICFSLFAIFAAFGVLGNTDPWDFLFPSFIAIISPIIFEVYFVVLGIVQKEIKKETV